MALIKFVLVIFLVSFAYSKPVEDEDTVVIVAADLNSIDGIDEEGVGEEDKIDLSHWGTALYGMPNKDSGDAVSEWSEDSLMNPEEMGEYAEGDMLVPNIARNGKKAESYRWANGIIPYSIEGNFNQQQREIIMRSIADYHRLTCLRFVPYNGQTDYIAIKSESTGCWSSVGRIGGRQEVNLQNPGCITKKGTVLHELLHAVGFGHEQSRPERDDFVDIKFNNIKPGTEPNFRKEDPQASDGFGVPYDYNSVMHYSEYAFSKNSQRTIVPKVGGVTLGQREGLSRGDVKKINNMYKCKKEEPQTGWAGQIWQSFFGKTPDA